MDKQGIQEKLVIHITIDKIVMNFKGSVGQVINGDVKGEFKVLMDSCIEEIEQHIYKNRGQVAGLSIENS